MGTVRTIDPQVPFLFDQPQAQDIWEIVIDS